MYGQCQGVEAYKSLVSARIHLERTSDGKGYHGHLQLVGQLEGSFLEGYHLSVVCAASLGEDYQRGASLEYAACTVDGLLDFLRP